MKLNSTPPTPSSLINELRTRYKATFEFPSTSSSAPEGTILFNRYKLKGKPAFGVSKSVRYADTNAVLSNMQEATNMFLSQFNVVMNSISDTRDAIVPRLFMLLPGKKSYTVFKPKTWGKDTFVVHILCEGLVADNSEAHFTDHRGYKVCYVQ